MAETSLFLNVSSENVALYLRDVLIAHYLVCRHHSLAIPRHCCCVDTCTGPRWMGLEDGV